MSSFFGLSLLALAMALNPTVGDDPLGVTLDVWRCPAIPEPKTRKRRHGAPRGHQYKRHH